MIKQRILLRSILAIKHDKKEITSLVENFEMLQNSNLEIAVEVHQSVFNFIKEHTSKFTEVPSFDRIKAQFSEDSEIVDELDKIASEKALFGSNFKSLLTELFNDQQKRLLNKLLKDVARISENGLKINREYITGPKEAAKYFMFESHQLLKSESQVQNEGSLKGDSSKALQKYYDIKNNNQFRGILTGLETIDMSCRGLKPGELWLILAAPGHLKTTVSMNFAYVQAIEQKKNIKFISLEMPYDQVKDLFICIHSANYNLWEDSKWKDVFPIEYNDLEEGNLSEKEEEFLEFLTDDLDNNPNYGFLDIYQPPDGLSPSHLKSYLEIENRKKIIHAAYIDYIELMSDDAGAGGKEYTLTLNARIKGLKQLALGFDNGRGLRLISAYQANRKGLDHADKNDGEYRMDALSYANEAERSADVIIYSYLNQDLRDNHQAKIGCLKNRTKSLFKPFLIKTILSSRKIYEPITTIEDLESNDINSLV